MEACLRSDEISSSDLTDFLENLKNSPTPIAPETLANQLRNMNLTLADLARWIIYDPLVYARNRVALFPNAEVLVMCWRPGQITPIHNHTNSACAVRVMQGTATEITYKKSKLGALVPVSAEEFAQGEVVGSFDDDTHQLGNFEGADKNLVTFHCYSPPLKKMHLFEETETFFCGYNSLMKNTSGKISAAKLLS